MTRNTTIGAALALLTLAAGSCLGQGTPCVGWYFTRTKEVSHPCSQFCAPHTHKWPALVKLKCDYATHACDETYSNQVQQETNHPAKDQGHRMICWAMLRHACVSGACILHNCGSPTVICCEGDYLDEVIEHESYYTHEQCLQG